MGPAPSFEQLSAQVDQKQREILSAIWQYFLAKKQWPPTRVIHHRFGKKEVQAALKPLGGTVVWDILDSGKQRYELRFLGVLLTDQGVAIEQLLVEYLQMMVRTFNANPELETIRSVDAEAELGLSPEQALLLGKVLFMSPLQGGGGLAETKWGVHFPQDIDDYPPDKSDLRRYLRERVILQYDPAVPVEERERMLHYAQAKLGKELEQNFQILYSRNQAVEDFERWSQKLRPTGLPIAVLFVDIDFFKALNTTYGEPKIDQTILPEAQRLLVPLVIGRGEPYRYGGDEFVVILPNHSAEEAIAFAKRIGAAFKQYPFTVDGIPESLTVSTGIALWPLHGRDYQEVLQRASETKQTAKGDRDTVKVFEPGLGKDI